MAGTILLVEDSPEAVELTRNALEECSLAGNSVTVAYDGQDAIDYLFGTGRYKGRNTADLPKVVLLDLRLPKLDGFEVLAKIRSDSLTRLVPVVILTVSKLKEDIRRSYELGANSYLIKVLDYDEYQNTINAACAYWLGINQRAY
ncbi:MAG: response regulator [Deltaproteobacteria bacterium]|nr:response regulator [Deltaproteobacteria bacterium]